MPHVLVVLVVLCACGGVRSTAPLANQVAPGPPLLAPSPAAIHPGEKVTYDIAVAGIDVGEVAVAVGQPGTMNGERIVVVAGRATATGVAQLIRHLGIEAESRIELDTGRPIDVTGEVVWGARRYRGIGAFAGPIGEMSWYRDSTLVEHARHDVGDGIVHVAPTAVAAVRGWTGEPGELRRIHVSGAVRLFRVDLRWMGTETIGTAKGNQPAIRIEATAVVVTPGLDPDPNGPEIRFSIWLSDDSDRVPLRVVAAAWMTSAVFELSSYQRGVAR